MARSGENLRDRILDAAVDLLRKEGVKKLSQTQIARAAGIPQGHLTYYFPRRADLLLAVGQRSIEHLAAEMAQFLAGKGWPGADASARAKALALVGFLMKNRERTRMLLALLVEAEEEPALRETLAEHYGRLRMLLAHVLQWSVDDPDLDIALATLWGLGIQHLLFQRKKADERTDELLARLAALFDVWDQKRRANERESR